MANREQARAARAARLAARARRDAERREVVAGDGCRFRPRCPFAMDACNRRPPEVRVGPDEVILAPRHPYTQLLAATAPSSGACTDGPGRWLRARRGRVPRSRSTSARGLTSPELSRPDPPPASRSQPPSSPPGRRRSCGRIQPAGRERAGRA
ncbi:hypothetical protein [Streptomyces sp. 5-6(2022)]|uniref:ABC transporter ATP-binding protein n=1 Tax=Streptomyces sp. 5-6(2022) TaxID=2936510 RepID=UPI0023B91F78|nr:hypothetical protein [Streptomyces sp. 5-6(2022)]